MTPLKRELNVQRTPPDVRSNPEFLRGSQKRFEGFRLLVSRASFSNESES
jgi:hypothetical protein